MTEQVNGLLTQKPDSPAPVAGNTQRFSWEQKTGKAGKPYIKIKNEGADYGHACEVVTAEKTDFQDKHGNVSFNVSFIPQDDAAGGVGEAQSSNGSSSAATSDERGEKIDRAVAFKGAVRVIAYEVQSGNCKPEDVPRKVEALTASLFAVLQGAAEGKAEPPLMDTAESVQADQTFKDDSGKPVPF
jgi:hypothetical protein